MIQLESISRIRADSSLNVLRTIKGFLRPKVINYSLLQKIIRLSKLSDTYQIKINQNRKKAISEHNSTDFHISEIFDSMQFENNIVSFCKPTIFIRFSGCNLRCFGCDSAYALDVSENPVYTRKEVFDKIIALQKNCNTDSITITGGESLIHQEPIESLIKKFKHCKFDIETNGTIIPNDFLVKHVHFWNISPKFSNMAKNGIKPSVISFFNKLPNCIYKFVIDSEIDLKELEAEVSRCKIPKDKVVLMPKGIQSSVIIEKSLWLIEYCKQKGYRYSPRLHIMLYGNKRAV